MKVQARQHNTVNLTLSCLSLSLPRYDVPEISKYLDYINIMSYDFHGMWDTEVGHNSPLLPLETASSYQKKLTVVSIEEGGREGQGKGRCL